MPHAFRRWGAARRWAAAAVLLVAFGAPNRGAGAAKKSKPPAAPAAGAAAPAPAADKAPSASGGAAAPAAEERARLHFRAGRALMDLGRFSDAAVEFEAGHTLAPRAAFLYNLGQALWYEGKLAPALAKLEAALKFTSPPPDAALAKLIREDIERVRLESRGGAKAPRPAPPKDAMSLAKIHYELAGATFDLGRFADAMASFRAGYKLYARPGFLLNMATCLESLGDHAEAIRHAEGYIAHAGPTDPNVAMARELIERARRAEEARKGKGGAITAEVTELPGPGPSRRGSAGWWIAGGAAVALAAGAAAVVAVLFFRPAEPDWTIDEYGPLSP